MAVAMGGKRRGSLVVGNCVVKWTRWIVIRVVSGRAQRVRGHHEELASGPGGRMRIKPVN